MASRFPPDDFVPDEQFATKSAVVWELSKLAKQARQAACDGNPSKPFWDKMHALMRKYNIGEGGGMHPDDL